MPRDTLRILVVDDDPTNVQWLEGVLRQEYRVLVAENGDQALNRAKEELPDLILLEVMLPDLNGCEVARLLKADRELAALPIILLSAINSPEAEAEGLEAGAIDYLVRPVDPGLLLLRVRNHLQLKRQNDLIRQQRDELEGVTETLEAALERVKRLEGTFAICMHCKSIRCDQEGWQKIEEYLLDHTDALFSHGICPNCLERHYPKL